MEIGEETETITSPQGGSKEPLASMMSWSGATISPAPAPPTPSAPPPPPHTLSSLPGSLLHSHWHVAYTTVAGRLGLTGMLKKFMCTIESTPQNMEEKQFRKPTQRFWTVTSLPEELSSVEIQKILRHAEDKGSALSEEETIPPSIYIPCPPKGTVNKIITNGAILVLFWCVIWSVTGPEVLPGGSLFGLLIIFYCAILGGKLLEIIRIPSVPQLPPLIGMLLAGFILRNIPILNQYISINRTWSSSLRNTALTIILIRAGLGLDPQALKHLKAVCLRLFMGPCLLESCSAAVFSHFIMKLPWEWSFLLGFVIGAVSPAVVVPSMLLLQEDGYGVQKGIPTLLIAASSLDDILAITGFSTCMSIVFSSGNILHTLLISLLEVFIGVVVGALLGFFIRYFPSRDQKKLHGKRTVLILATCVTAVLGSQRLGLHGVGGLCTLVLSFVSGIYWSREKIRVQKLVAATWNIFQPLLFGLVGSEVSVSNLPSQAIGIGVATLSLALMVRLFVTFLLMCFAGFNFKEKLFIALAWMPKATVQAVLGPLALETARNSAHHLEGYAQEVMTLAFLAILITAPNGALLIGLLGPKMLASCDPKHYKKSVDTILIHH
ncbi:PREDICTED: sodium/hydrogen exchanger 9B1-like [Elephantulus edwardii]|uniref:sodium/hydrogen exchanger 9B1-like n=1 Tax=Elephantulus edwardii TaxID=28737 RepID=UPI0003F05B7D|nr:PREDICTED: sodium/hydrogen exchanger 9B1-like [Elephantulus edwardii]